MSVFERGLIKIQLFCTQMYNTHKNLNFTRRHIQHPYKQSVLCIQHPIWISDFTNERWQIWWQKKSALCKEFQEIFRSSNRFKREDSSNDCIPCGEYSIDPAFESFHYLLTSASDAEGIWWIVENQTLLKMGRVNRTHLIGTKGQM